MKNSNKLLLGAVLLIVAIIFITVTLVRFKFPGQKLVMHVADESYTPVIQGNGNLMSRRYPIRKFKRLELDVNGLVAVHIRRGDPLYSKAVVTTDVNILPHLKFRNIGNKLVVKTIGNVQLRPSKRLHITFYMNREITNVSISGAHNLDVRGIDNNTFNFDVSGANRCKLTGKVNKLKLNISGASKVDAKNLIANDVKIDASGATEVLVTAHKKLDLNISGMSKVTYYGNPKTIKKDLGGLVKVDKGS